MLRPDIQWKNPVMFVVEIGTILTLLYIIQFAGKLTSVAPIGYFIALDAWLFLTVLFANFATAFAEARGKAQADSLSAPAHDTVAYLIAKSGAIEEVSSNDLKPGDRVSCGPGRSSPATAK